MINEILDLVLKINKETKYAAWFDLMGHVKKCEVRVTESKEKFDNKYLLYGWMRYRKGFNTEGQFYLDDLEKQKQIYQELLSFLPKENRPATTQDDE